MKSNILFLCLLALAIFLDSLCEFDCGCQLALGLGLGLAIAGGASLLGSVIGAASNASNTDAVNAANLQAARETNALNEKMFNQQMDYNKYMYEDQKAYNDKLIQQMNDYNSPTAQRQRFEDAGINPYFALGNIDAGNASSQVGVSPISAPSAPNIVTPQFQKNDVGSFIAGAGRDLASVMQAYANTENIQAQTEQTRIDNLTRLDENIARLEGMRSNNNLTEAQINYIDEQITDARQQRSLILDGMRHSNRRMSSEADMAEINTRKTALEERFQELQNDYQEWFNGYQKQYGDKQIKQIDAIISNLRADTAVKAMQELEKKASAKGIQIDNEQKRKLMPLLERQQSLDNEAKSLENKYGSNLWTGSNRWYDRIKSYRERNLQKRYGYFNRTSRW